MLTENQFRATVRNYIVTRGGKCCLLNKDNWPDMLVVPYRMPCFFIEFKRQIKGQYRQTEGQKRVQDMMERRGHTYFLLAYDMEPVWHKVIERYVVPLHELEES